jgi:hypothetical protein
MSSLTQAASMLLEELMETLLLEGYLLLSKLGISFIRGGS